MTKTLGELAVRLSAKTQGFMKSFDEAVDKVEELADEVEELASKGAAALGDMSDGFLTVAAAATGAFIVGAQGNKEMAGAMKELEEVTRTLAVEFGKDLIPLVKDITKLLKDAVATYRNLTQEQRQAIVEGVKWAFILGTGAKALERALMFGKSFAEMTVAIARAYKLASPSVISGLKAMGKAGADMGSAIAKGARDAAVALGNLGKTDVSKLRGALSSRFDTGAIGAGVDRMAGGAARAAMAIPTMLSGAAASFSAMAAASAPVLAAVLAITAAVGALIVLAAVLRDTWEQTGDGLAGHFRYMGMVADEMAGKVANFVEGLFNSLKNFLMQGTQQALEYIAAGLRWLATAGKGLANSLGLTKAVKMFDALSQASGKKMMEYVEKGADVAFNATEQVVGAVSGLASEVATKAKAGLVATGKTLGETLKTSMESAKRGFKLLDEDLGLSDIASDVKAFFSAMSFNIPGIADGSNVQGTKTLDELEKAADEARKLAEEQERWEKELSALADQAEEASRAEYISAIRAESANAADNFRAIADEARELAEAAERARKEAVDALSSKMMDRTGDLAGVLESGAQGAQAGGIWGAIIAVILDLLSRSEQFKAVIEMLNQIIQMLSDTLGELFDAIGPVVAVIMNLVMIIVQALKPVLVAASEALEPLGAVFVMVGKVIMPILTIFGQMLTMLTEVLNPIIEVALKGLFIVLQGLGIFVLWIVIGLGKIWNGIIDAIQDVFRALADLEIDLGPLGKIDPFEFLNGWANSLDGAKIKTDEYAKMLVELKGYTWEAAQAEAERIKQMYEGAAAQERLNEELLNAPRAWRIALNRYRAQDGQKPPTSTPPSGGSDPGTMGPGGGRGGGWMPPDPTGSPGDGSVGNPGGGGWTPPVKNGGWAGVGGWGGGRSNPTPGDISSVAEGLGINVTIQAHDTDAAARAVERILNLGRLRLKAGT